MNQTNRITAVFLGLLASSWGIAAAQTRQQAPEDGTGSPSSRGSTQGTRTPNRDVTSTGATVPNPGASQIGPETERERRAQERSNDATKMICKGC